MSWTQQDTDDLNALIDRAEREGKWLFCQYQQLWFSPQDLRDQNANGCFRWGVVNWQLRDPGERVSQAEIEALEAKDRAKRVADEVAAGRAWNR